VSTIIADMEGVAITVPLDEDKDKNIRGTVAISVEGRTESFDVLINTQYPQQFHEMETIRFSNMGLIENNHVNWDGSICLHTLHSPDLSQKLQLDFGAVKAWMLKYLINQETDAHYEHIVVPAMTVKDVNSVMLFTEMDHTFKSGEFGKTEFSLLQNGKVKDVATSTYILQSVQSEDLIISCKWSAMYQAMDKYEGIYLFMDKPPVKNRRFALKNWQDLTGYLPYPFLDYLQNTERRLSAANYGRLTLMLGYPIGIGSEIHWEMIVIEKKHYPNYRQRVKGTRFFAWNLKDQPILWGETKDCSYAYFFGRGRLSEKLAAKKILILGLGAIGSMVATTLCRGGCTDFTIFDYDAKEPGNVCRSEYQFFSGINNKVDELQKHLMAISPFINVSGESMLTDGIKILLSSPDWKPKFESYFDAFDLIIDCTTDNDLALLLSQLNFQKDIINLSITNHAHELVCVTGPNLYSTVMHMFGILQREDDPDLFNPTGCWNPTFKAGYNDIAVLVQFAIRQINLSYQKHLPLRSFYLTAQEEDNFHIKLTQF
jgi:hypothetical protein